MQLTYAQSVIEKALEAARGQNLAVAAVVVDAAGQVVASARMDGVAAIMLEGAGRKALTAAAFKSATHELLHMVSRDELAKTAIMNDPALNLLPGGVALKQSDAIIGAIGIAGGYYLQDQAIAEFAGS